jgi:MoxR-like ATPase
MPPPIVTELKLLIQSFHAVVAIETPEEERVRDLLRAAGLDLYFPLFEWSITRGLRNTASREGIAATDEPKRLLRHLFEQETSGIYLLLDFTKHLDDARVCRQFREVAQVFQLRQSTMVLCGDPLVIPPDLQHLVTSVDLPLPTVQELASVVTRTVQALAITNTIEINLDRDGQERYVRHLGGLTLAQARQAVAYSVLDNHRLDLDDLRDVLRRKARLLSGHGAVEFIPLDANRGELGGFNSLKSWLARAQQGYSKAARDRGLEAPRGILIVGVQGCGKSLAAKAVAREWSLPLLKFDAGRLYDKFVGESERNFRRTLASAEAMAPCVLWIDEIEKAMGAVQSSESDGGLSRRIFGSFLTWLQERRSEVFVVATANDLSQLPPEFLRKGRFDEIFFVDLPDDSERNHIFHIHLRQRKQNPDDFDLDELVHVSQGYSGAEIEQAIIAGCYRGLHLGRELDTELLLAEIRYLIPLSRARREDVDRLRALAADRFVNVR